MGYRQLTVTIGNLLPSTLYDMENQPLVPVQKMLAEFGISKTSLYKYIAKIKVSTVKRNGNIAYVSQDDYAKIAKNYRKKATKDTTVQGDDTPIGNLADTLVENQKLHKQTETLQYQIKEYAERFIDMKQRAEELKTDKEQLASKLEEVRQKNEALHGKNATLGVFVAIFAVLFLVAVCLFFWLR